MKRFPLIEMRMRRADCLAWLNWHGYPLPPNRRASAAPSMTTPDGATCGTTTPTRGQMPSTLTVPSGPACARSEAKCSCIALLYRSMKRTCRRQPTAASSICGPTSARVCAASSMAHRSVDPHGWQHQLAVHRFGRQMRGQGGRRSGRRRTMARLARSRRVWTIPRPVIVATTANEAWPTEDV